MGEKAPRSLYSWFPYPYRLISLCGTTASLNTVEFFFNIIGFCSCCHVPSSGVSVVFGWSSWRVCLCLSLFARGRGRGCVVLRRKDAGRKKSAECKETPRGCLWSDETNDIVTTRNADIWVSSDWIPILGVTIRIQNQLSIQTILNWNNEIVRSVLIIWQIMQSKRSTVCEIDFFFLLSFMESVSIRKLYQPITGPTTSLIDPRRQRRVTSQARKTSRQTEVVLPT